MIEKRQSMRRGDIKVCNCAECGEVLLGLSNPPIVLDRCRIQKLAGRIDGRPYCGHCYKKRLRESVMESLKPPPTRVDISLL